MNATKKNSSTRGSAAAGAKALSMAAIASAAFCWVTYAIATKVPALDSVVFIGFPIAALIAMLALVLCVVARSGHALFASISLVATGWPIIYAVNGFWAHSR